MVRSPLMADAGERELLHCIGSPAEFDFDREPGAVCFEPAQERALDHAAGHWRASKDKRSSPS
jgi:hypothetical protein